MSDNDKAKKLAAAKKKLKAYQNSSHKELTSRIVKENSPNEEEPIAPTTYIQSNQLQNSASEDILQQIPENNVVSFVNHVDNSFGNSNLNTIDQASTISKLQNYFETSVNSFSSLLGQTDGVQSVNNELLGFVGSAQSKQNPFEDILQSLKPIDSFQDLTLEYNSNHQFTESMSVNQQPSYSDQRQLNFFNTLNSIAPCNQNEIGTLHTTEKQQPTLASSIEKFDNPANMKTIELLISEKASISSDLFKAQTLCKEKEFELEELQLRFNSAKQQIEDLEQYFFAEQKKSTEFQKLYKSYETENEKQKTELKTYLEYIEELKYELEVERSKNLDLTNQVKEKNSKIELNAIRINQISDETNITIDNRIEKLTQTKFMYEQQIVDLQTMVNQLRAEKDSANQQYQSYVQHLNKDISVLSEKNSELLDENSKLLSRENDLVHHVSGLEKQIQQNIINNENIRDNLKNGKADDNKSEILELKEKLSASEKLKEQYESQIQVNNSELRESQKLLHEKSEKVLDLEERLENITSDRPNDSKLLAQIESDKVAASRAMTQNAELRKQLDELQLKLIDLVNDKADLTNILHSEKHANKEMRGNYESFENQIQVLSEKLHFKDEEMIRLSRENNELKDNFTRINKNHEDIELNHKHHNDSNEHLQVDNHDGRDHDGSKNDPENVNGNIEENDTADHQTIEIATEAISISSVRKSSTVLPTNEAMQKLEHKFTKLIGEVADLTDEKQRLFDEKLRLEHLVLQLQGETETIGEYIALYQTQRRQLKQKEIEKDTQLHRLQSERESLREKLSQLNRLISTLGIPLHQQQSIISHLSGEQIENGKNDEKLAICDLNNSSKIIDQIHTLISEIKEKEDNILNSAIVDHCACCQGTLETI